MCLLTEGGGQTRSGRKAPSFDQVDSAEAKLLAAAHPRLQRLIIAALETAARRGELLSLQWREVDLARRE
ncbi:MAG: hypothetical protein QF681_19775, partial [Vicinamibacterales bacterium]|nr:hypothetical protein [Vicinamibacterales bacterium]